MAKHEICKDSGMLLTEIPLFSTLQNQQLATRLNIKLSNISETQNLNSYFYVSTF